MSQVPFQFDFFQESTTSPEESPSSHDDDGPTLPHRQPPPPTKNGAPEKRHPFRLIEGVPHKLRDRRKQQLEYKILDLNASLHIDDETSRDPRRLLNVCSRIEIETGDSTNLIQDLENKNTDILSGVYEGGLKVWESSLDLCRYLSIHCRDMLDTCSEGIKVLELGCGHALPACSILNEAIQRRKNVTIMLTDYNDFVLHGIALSNLVLNSRSLDSNSKPDEPNDFVDEHIVMGAGDWMDMSEQFSSKTLQKQNKLLPSDGRFDILLCAETTYTAEAARDTAVLLARHLKPESGVGLVACKRYYFGVGGGSDAFREAAAAQRIVSTAQEDPYGTTIEYGLSVETLKVYDSGIGNIRELLQIKCIPCS